MKPAVEPVRLREVAAGVVQVRLPLPFRLNHVNCYLLRGDKGWTIVDTGINTALARRGWEIALDEVGITPADIDQLIVTHVHPDHFGLAGWLQERVANAGRPEPLPVYMSAPEYGFFSTVWSHPRMHLQSMVDYFKRGGMPPDLSQSVAEETGNTGRRTLPHPRHISILKPGEQLAIGERRFTVLTESGHSPGVILLHDEARRELFCSDHMLVKITPHIGFWPNMPDEPLTDFLASLRRLRSLAVDIAYPGHRSDIEDWSGRLGELLTHHANRLEETYEAVPAGSLRTVAQIATTVFRLGELNAHEMRFAMAETWSHIIWLVKAGRLVEMEQAGIAKYRRR